MDQREEWNRARWASRRGLLELDLLLSPFVEHEFVSLEPALRQLYRDMLYQDDQDLLEWIMGRSEVAMPDFLPVIAEIRAYHQLDG
ncbi:MAG: succinate dehydrogenase assembly factor 2 [Luminiphilus sp.]|jgi:antitoxin CptB|nr:succinate dehydrogenase assembly factor 2 [Luminiphilus sp.]